MTPFQSPMWASPERGDARRRKGRAVGDRHSGDFEGRRVCAGLRACLRCIFAMSSDHRQLAETYIIQNQSPDTTFIIYTVSEDVFLERWRRGEKAGSIPSSNWLISRYTPLYPPSLGPTKWHSMSTAFSDRVEVPRTNALTSRPGEMPRQQHDTYFVGRLTW